ncbi:MAG: hypothetical protein JXR64_06065 [Spirochaetales bacterium]|nr:hypothetical protein [Spirochaetales bacterium]
MSRDEIIKFANYIINSVQRKKIIPLELFKNVSELNSDSSSVYKLLVDTWNNSNISEYSEVNHPLNLSRGFKDDLTTEEQLASYLPEEKILINKDIFRNRLESIDLVSINNNEQQKIINSLNKDSIGLTNNDVLLYYNLIKINQISKKNSSQLTSNTSSRNFAQEIFDLAIKSFNMTNLNIKKTNGGKLLEEIDSVKILKDSIDSKRINPYVLTICLGFKKSKFVDFFVNFITYMVEQRGDDVQEVLTYIGFYILFNGSSPKQFSILELSSNVEAFVNDRIGRVKSVYYVAMLFAHTFNVLLTAQMYEISEKYQNSSVDQRLKLEKLYSADTRRSLLVSNSITIATRKIASFKNESLEVQNAFKRFSGNTKDLISVKDLFDTNWSSK